MKAIWPFDGIEAPNGLTTFAATFDPSFWRLAWTIIFTFERSPPVSSRRCRWLSP
jgi:hypothetical protein